MNNKSIILLIAAALMSLTIVNCSSSSNDDGTKEVNTLGQTNVEVDAFVSAERPNDFPEGSTKSEFNEGLSAFVVTSQESGCRVLVKPTYGGSYSIDSETDCSQ